MWRAVLDAAIGAGALLGGFILGVAVERQRKPRTLRIILEDNHHDPR